MTRHRLHRGVITLGALALLGGTSLAQQNARSSAPRPLVDLPAHVQAPDKTVSLFADFKSASGGQIQLYLINRSSRPLQLPTQDGVLYVKLEAAIPARSGARAWTRAQRHVYSSCGNSYDGIALQPGQFVRVPHWYPTHGTRTSVRYRLEGTTQVVSNPGAGRFEPVEAARARVDALAMKSADVATVREVLLTKPAGVGAAPARNWERESARRAAIERIKKLAAPANAVLAEELVSSPWLDPNEYSQAMRVLHEVAPDRLATHVIALVAAPPSAPRTRLIHELPFLPTINDKALTSVLLQRARDPKSPDVPFVLDYLAAYRTADVEALLESVRKDTRYPRPTRILARYDHEQWFGAKGIDVRIGPIGGYSDGHKRPVAMDVTIINASGAPLTFAYDRPTDILSLYLSRASGREKVFLAPKKSVRWFTGTGTGATRVTLDPGKSHVVRIALETYFDLSPPTGGGLSVWVSVKLPGAPGVARLGGGGAGINPK